MGLDGGFVLPQPLLNYIVEQCNCGYCNFKGVWDLNPWEGGPGVLKGSYYILIHMSFHLGGELLEFNYSLLTRTPLSENGHLAILAQGGIVV